MPYWWIKLNLPIKSFIFELGQIKTILEYSWKNKRDEKDEKGNKEDHLDGLILDKKLGLLVRSKFHEFY